MKISELRPELVWKNFEKITQIPRPSKHEEKIIAFVEDFAKKLDLNYQKDKLGNLIIRKNATKGMEDRKMVTLQAHLDMVPQKNSDVEHDFEKDPINAYIHGEWVTAKDTTLGADNGIGVAASLAILEADHLQHGPIEVLFTVDEETGLTGAMELADNLLQGDILINLDSEDEGELYVGCAGGIQTDIEIDIIKENNPEGHEAFEVSIKGLEGGHSGCDIHLGRGNSNKLLNRLLWNLQQKIDFRLAEFNGGDLHNAIPREAFAKITIAKDKVKDLKNAVAELGEILEEEYKSTDAGIAFEIKNIKNIEKVWEKSFQTKFINAIYACPHGLTRLIPEQREIVETSTNLASIQTLADKIKIITSQRSSVDSARDDMVATIRSVFELIGGKVNPFSSYPGWKPNLNSPILKVMQKAYEDNFEKEAEIKIIHAGLECGLIGAKYPHMDMISFGPTIRNPHSPDEKVHIDSVSKFWDFLIITLENIPQKD